MIKIPQKDSFKILVCLETETYLGPCQTSMILMTLKLGFIFTDLIRNYLKVIEKRRIQMLHEKLLLEVMQTFI